MAQRSSIPTVRLQHALAAIAATILIQNRGAIKQIPSLLQPNNGNTRKMLIGIAVIYTYEQAVAKSLQKMGLNLPPSLIAMIVAFLLLNAYAAAAGDEAADSAARYLKPAVDHLGKWMPLYLVPPLVTLPNAVGDMGCEGGAIWAKMGGIHIAGWLATLVTTAVVASHVEEACAGDEGAKEPEAADKPAPAAGAGAVPAPIGTTSATAVAPEDGNGSAQAEAPQPAAAEAGAAAAEAGERTAAAKADAPTTAPAGAAPKPAAAPKTKEQKMREAWGVITAATFVLAPVTGCGPATFSTTVLALLRGNALPARTKAVLHPLVTCAVVTGVVSAVLGRSEGRTISGALTHYFSKKGMVHGGAGDVFFGLLSACCAALGVRMFVSRRTLFDNATPLVASTLFSSTLSLFGTTAACGAVGLPPPLTFTLAQRSVMSSLGIPAAIILGGNAGMAVASILLTGIYGASFGKSILDAMGVTRERPVPRGIATGASAHSIGTAALLEEEPEAGAISSVSLCLAGVFHTVLCSIPAVQYALRKLARV